MARPAFVSKVGKVGVSYFPHFSRPKVGEVGEMGGPPLPPLSLEQAFTPAASTTCSLQTNDLTFILPPTGGERVGENCASKWASGGADYTGGSLALTDPQQRK